MKLKPLPELKIPITFSDWLIFHVTVTVYQYWPKCYHISVTLIVVISANSIQIIKSHAEFLLDEL